MGIGCRRKPRVARHPTRVYDRRHETSGFFSPARRHDGRHIRDPQGGAGRVTLEGEVIVIRRCPSCGKRNRIPARNLTAIVRCGSCKTVFPVLAEPVDADPSLLDEVMREAKVPVLVDFWADWCGPCRMAAPEVERTASAMAGRAVVLKVDTEAHPDLAARFGISGLPSFVVLKNGQVVFKQVGLVRQPQMEEWLTRAAA